MLTKSDLLTDITHDFWKMDKGSILYDGGKKYGLYPNGWRGKML